MGFMGYHGNMENIQKSIFCTMKKIGKYSIFMVEYGNHRE
jgi:hypothetical protein